MSYKMFPILILILLHANKIQAQIFHPYLFFTESQLEDRRKSIIQDNEFVRNEKGKHTIIHSNPLLLNGQIFDVGILSTNSFGMVTIVKGKPGTKESSPLPFKAYLRRDGEIVPGPFDDGNFMKIDIGKLLKNSRPGDFLVFEPLEAEDYKAKRILKLID